MWEFNLDYEDGQVWFAEEADPKPTTLTFSTTARVHIFITLKEFILIGIWNNILLNLNRKLFVNV